MVSGAQTIVTYGLGSCVALCVYSVKAPTGGMLHFMLPDSTQDAKNNAKDRPGVYADTGFAALMDGLRRAGVAPNTMRVKLVGGAAVSSAVRMDIGARNVLAAKRLLWQHHLPVEADETGGHIARTVRMSSSGLLIVSSPGTEDRRL